MTRLNRLFAAFAAAACWFEWTADASARKPEPSVHVYKTVDSLDIRADVYTPSEDAPPFPTLVYIHGGALIYGSRSAIREAQLRRYLDAGFAVVSIDYRLAPETKLPGIVEDVVDAFRWTRGEGPELFGADPARIGVVGHSGGGYLALMAGLRVEPRLRAVVSFYGYGDILGKWYAEPDGFYNQRPKVSAEESGLDIEGPPVAERAFSGTPMNSLYLYCRQNGLWPKVVGGRDPNVDAEFFIPYCPAESAGPDFPPTLLLHGTADTDVPHSQSVQMAGALREMGVEHRLISIPGGPHGFDRDLDDPVAGGAFGDAVEFLKERLAP